MEEMTRRTKQTKRKVDSFEAWLVKHRAKIEEMKENAFDLQQIQYYWENCYRFCTASEILDTYRAFKRRAKGKKK